MPPPKLLSRAFEPVDRLITRFLRSACTVPETNPTCYKKRISKLVDDVWPEDLSKLTTIFPAASLIFSTLISLKPLIFNKFLLVVDKTD